MWITVEVKEGFEIPLYENWLDKKRNSLGGALFSSITDIFIPCLKSEFLSCDGGTEIHRKLMFPGYIFIDVNNNEVIKNISSQEGVTSILSKNRNHPYYLEAKEIDSMKNKVKESFKKLYSNLEGCKRVRILNGMCHNLEADIVRLEEEWVEVEVKLMSIKKVIRFPLWDIEKL